MAPEIAELFGEAMLLLPDAHAALVIGDASRFSASPRSYQAGGLPYGRTSTGVAIIPIMGPLLNRAGGYQLSYQLIQGMLAEVRRDKAIKGVLLDISSPGGAAGGAFETAAAVRAVAAEKPVVAVVNDLAASAAYAIASGANRIVTTPSGISGSIGVSLVHADMSGMLEKAGITPTLIHAGARKIDGNPYQPLSQQAKATLQGEVNALYDLFVKTVATGRSKLMTESAVRATEARVYTGAAAVQAGLADEVGSFESALAMLPGSMRVGSVSAPIGTITTQSRSNDDMAQADYERGRAEERARITAIFKLPEAKGRELLVSKLAEHNVSVEDAKRVLAVTPSGSLSLAERASGVPRLGAGTAGDGAAASGADAWDDVIAKINAENGVKRPS